MRLLISFAALFLSVVLLQLGAGGTLLTGLFSSVGSEHLPYKQGVRGSNPRRDTK